MLYCDFLMMFILKSSNEILILNETFQKQINAALSTEYISIKCSFSFFKNVNIHFYIIHKGGNPFALSIYKKHFSDLFKT